MKNSYILLIFVILFLAGCATNQVRVTYYSDPPGATFYEWGVAIGYTPFTRIVTPPRRPEAHQGIWSYQRTLFGQAEPEQILTILRLTFQRVRNFILLSFDQTSLAMR